MKNLFFHLSIGLFFVLPITLAGVQAQEPLVSPESAPEQIVLEALKDAVEADTGLSEQNKSKALAYYSQAQMVASEVQETEAAAAILRQRIETAPKRINQLRAELDTPGREVPLSLPAEASVEQLRQIFNQKLTDLRTAHESHIQHTQTLIDLQADSITLSDTIAQLQRTFRDNEEALRKAASSSEPEVITRARRVYLSARRQLTGAQLALNRSRQAEYEQLLRLQMLERDVSALQVAQLRQVVDKVDKHLQQQREREARARTELRRLAAADLPDPVAAIADELAQIRQELETLTRQGGETQKRLIEAGMLQAELESEFDLIRQRIAIISSTRAIGRILLQWLRDLPSMREYQREIRARRAEINHAANRRIEIEEISKTLLDAEALSETLLAEIEMELPGEERDRLKEETLQLLRAQRDTLAELELAYSWQLIRLSALDNTQRRQAATVQNATRFIKARLLWIRSLPPFDPADLMQLPDALAGLFSPAAWNQVLRDAYVTFKNQFTNSLLAVLLIAFIFLLRKKIPGKLEGLTSLTRKVRSDRFSHTLKALAYTVLAASAWPLLLAFIGWQFYTPDSATPFGMALGGALLVASAALIFYHLTLANLVPNGLYRGHLRWPDLLADDLARISRHSAWIIVPAAFIVTFTILLPDPRYALALGRPVFITALLTLIWFLWTLFAPNSTSSQFVQTYARAWMRRLWPLLFPLLLAILLALVLSSALGYHRSALAFGLLFLESVFYLLALLLLRDLLLRWAYITERRLRFEAALRQREALRAQREQKPSEEGTVFDVEEPELDYRELGQQSVSLVSAGFFLGFLFALGALWSDWLPVFSFLDQVQLPFNRLEIIESIEQQRAVTLNDAAIALLILVISVFAFRNLAGLLEFTLFRRTKLDSGARYALITLIQYIIIGVSILSALAIMGLDWSKLQWLVAALGVGLGFGLQEIVANFVSGIILLIERPIRIGDVVTVDNEMGVVARIQIRATTILTYEKRELIVPNKEFITSRVLNWTLSDSMNRLLLSVGIAYGADVAEATRLIAEAADENEYILKEPKPIITFEAFGDNALILELRCYLHDLDFRLTAKNALNEAIYRKLNDAGIVIAFPQRDVHLDTATPLAVRVQLDRDSGTN